MLRFIHLLSALLKYLHIKSRSTCSVFLTIVLVNLMNFYQKYLMKSSWSSQFYYLIALIYILHF